ncbi:hypothetical protein EVA_03601 [gut metagenome]|uniref:Uncharacterized protein n=1 Tax=gut metagenome TaxID=749906 RepID=J9H3M0_9ZZZZ
MQLSLQTQSFIREHQRDDVRTLALQSAKYPDVDMPVAITQIAGYQMAAEKIPSWSAMEGVWYPKHISLEQCSSEITARYKATLVEGDSLTDLTGGFGIDCSFLAMRFRRVTYVERQEELCEIAAHNFSLFHQSHISVCHADGVEFLHTMPSVSCIFLDPARRNEQGGKTVAIADCEPDVARLEDMLLEKAQQVLVKLSPMLDLSLALKELRYAKEVHVLSVNNECKELLLLLDARSPVEEIPIHCVNLSAKGNRADQHFVFTREGEMNSVCDYTHTVGTYLYEPNASLLKAGAFRSLAAAFSLKKLHPNSHLYTSDTWIDAFPGRAFRVVGQCGFGKKEMKEQLGSLKKANLAVRNFPASVAELRKRLKLADGGDNYLFATTLNNQQKVLICTVKAADL